MTHTWTYKRQTLSVASLDVCFPHSLFIPMVFLPVWTHNKHLSWLFFSVFYSLLCSFFFGWGLFFPWFLQSINIIMHLIVPVIELSSVSLLLSFHFHVGVFLCDFFFLMNVCMSLWCVCVCQCLQRIWKRVSGRWRGSCCSWRETWRLSPPPMTPTTCSSLKWLYPFL